MKFLKISDSTTLSQLSDMIKPRNVQTVLAVNGIERVPNIGQAFKAACTAAIAEAPQVSIQRKATILNTFTQDSDIFELAALSNDNDWKLLHSKNTFPNMLRIPESVDIPDSTATIGNGIGVSSAIYTKVMSDLQNTGRIDPAVFNEYSVARSSNILEPNGISTSSGPFQWFHIPWGEVTLFSSLGNDSIDFPVYPEELEDGVSANYTTMPDMLFQYEPWQMYESSGPRSNTYEFSIHRDMWTGDHRDGKCNELIRFCEANCYPRYNGSAVNTALVTLYISGQELITGVLTSVDKTWDGPIGLDGWYLHCTLRLSITEVSKEALNYDSVRGKNLIG